MIGAIIGDVVGSRFEFNNIKTKDFELIAKDSRPTDDSIMTIAVMDWCMNHKTYGKNEASRFLQKWGLLYPFAGYGWYFAKWLTMKDPKPYNSCGNGSAMRISPVAWFYDDEEEMIKAVDAITSVTHNHPEGMKGARVVAKMIFRARNGATKEELKELATTMYPRIKSLDYEELRKTYVHDAETCQATIPEALYCFLISNSFEDCLRTTISIGGDCDTTAAISCAIAEAYYGVNEDIKNQVMSVLDNDLKRVIKQFERKSIKEDTFI